MRLLILFILFFPHWAKANTLSDSYINAYKDIAISEMHRTGIPASIKLAQGLLESDWGRSDLATKANNHFGIKCGNTWSGDGFYKEDDDRDHRGKLVKSCFRSFADPYESYVAHSDFLTDPKKVNRYGLLFKLKRTDYKAWAKGLRKCGYASDPKYSNKLISIIEKYELFKYDTAVPTYASAPKESKDTQHVKKKSKSDRTLAKVVGEVKEKASESSPSIYLISKINRCRYIVARGGESISQLAQANYAELDKILDVNEMYSTGHEILNAGDIVFLDKKKRRFNGETEYHEVQPGETMERISQLYGIKLRSLYAKNKMPRGSQPVAYEKLALQKTVSRKERPKFIDEENDRQHTFLFADEDL